MIKLYEVNSTIPNYADTGVPAKVYWLMIERPEPLAVDYAEAIQDYEEAQAITRTAKAFADTDDPLSGLSMADDPAGVAEIAINELFTLEEAEQVLAFVREACDLESEIREVALPIPQEIFPTSFIPAGGDFDYLYPGRLADSLPFRVYGVIDRSLALKRRQED